MLNRGSNHGLGERLRYFITGGAGFILSELIARHHGR